MKIEINKDEYRALLDMLSIANWIMNAHETGSDSQHSTHEALKKKLFSYSKEMDAADIIQFSKEDNDYYETRDYEEYIVDSFVTPYEDEFFWDELAARLAERDYVNKIGAAKYSKMEPMERMSAVFELEDRYLNEFSEYGIDYLKINHDDLVKG